MAGFGRAEPPTRPREPLAYPHPPAGKREEHRIILPTCAAVTRNRWRCSRVIGLMASCRAVLE